MAAPAAQDRPFPFASEVSAPEHREDGSVSQEDGAISQEDGSISPEDGSMSQEDGSISQEDGSISQEDASTSEKQYTDQYIASPSEKRPPAWAKLSAARAGDSTSQAPTGASGALEDGIEAWRVAQRWRRSVEARLAPLELTLTHWLVLSATAQLIAERGDATNQARVAARLDMATMTLSQVMRGLEARGLVDRGPDFIGPGWRIWLTKSGRRALEEARRLLSG